MRAREPREQARPLPEGLQGPADPRPRRDHRAAGGGAGGVRPGGTGVHPRPRQPLRPRRRQAGGLPRRAAREVPRPHLRPGPLARPLRGNHRRDRRVRPARALPVGRGLPRQGRRGLRPHPGPRHHLDQQHHLPRHRRRLRRPDDRPALARAGTGRRTGREGLVRAGQAARRRGAGRARRPPARPGGRARPPGRGDPAPGQRERARGERGGGPGGHEPLRGGPPPRPVPAAHHGAHGHLPRGGLPGAPGRGLRPVPQGRHRPGGVRGEAHGLPRHRPRLQGRRRGPDPLRGRRPDGLRLHPHRTALLQGSGGHRGGPHPAALGGHRRGPLGGARHRLAAARRGTPALVPEVRRTAAQPVRRRRRGLRRRLPGRARRPGGGHRPGRRHRRAAGAPARPGRRRGRLHRLLPALLLDHRRSGRRTVRAVPAAGGGRAVAGRGAPRRAAVLAGPAG